MAKLLGEATPENRNARVSATLHFAVFLVSQVGIVELVPAHWKGLAQAVAGFIVAVSAWFDSTANA